MTGQPYKVRETQFTHGLRYQNEIMTHDPIRPGDYLLITHGEKHITLTVGSWRKGENELCLFHFQRQQLSVKPGDTVMVRGPVKLAVARRLELGVPTEHYAWVKGMDQDQVKKRLHNLPVMSRETKKIHLRAGKVLRALPLAVLSLDGDSAARVGEETVLTLLPLAGAEGSAIPGPIMPENEPSYPAVDPFAALVLEEKVARELLRRVIVPIKHPEVAEKLGIAPQGGIILAGQPGSGKTYSGKVLRRILGDDHFVTINGPEIIDKFWGESERKLREKFAQAQDKRPCLLFIDELDAVGRRRDKQTCSFEQTLVEQLLACLDGLVEREGVVMLGTTNRIGMIDPALRRPGRFDREIYLRVPDQAGRTRLLENFTKTLQLAPEINLLELAWATSGFTGADLRALCKEAHTYAVDRILPPAPLLLKGLDLGHLERPFVTPADFLKALHGVGPSILRPYQMPIEKIYFRNLGGLAAIKATIVTNVLKPWQHREEAQKTGIKIPQGIIFFGPPGNGKTMLAKAMAGELGWNVVGLAGSELFSKYVGEAEDKIKDLFQTARDLAPTLIIIDEIDACTAHRDASGEARRSVVNQLLYEMDGLTPNTDVAVVATTNALDLVDSAFLRAGRFDYQLLVPPPDQETRAAVLLVSLAKMNLAPEVDWEAACAALAEETEGLSSADLGFLAQEAGRLALKETDFARAGVIQPGHLVVSLEHLRVSREEVRVNAGKRDFSSRGIGF
jgi:transitional endoplasmic reticulum ATPase